MYTHNTGLHFILMSFRRRTNQIFISALIPKSIVVHTESLSNVAELYLSVIVFIDFSPLSLICTRKVLAPSDFCLNNLRVWNLPWKFYIHFSTEQVVKCVQLIWLDKKTKLLFLMNTQRKWNENNQLHLKQWK